MNLYVDASVLLRRVFAQTGRLAKWDEITTPISSELIRLESLRTIDRARITHSLEDAEVAERRRAVLAALESFELVPIQQPILQRATEPFPTLVGSLDAIHLATALLARRHVEELELATHDEELALAAHAVGFRVHGARTA
jgi:predicted nucleic acid-binding protein